MKAPKPTHTCSKCGGDTWVLFEYKDNWLIWLCSGCMVKFKTRPLDWSYKIRPLDDPGQTEIKAEEIGFWQRIFRAISTDTDKYEI